jgi:hypothetical protein
MKIFSIPKKDEGYDVINYALVEWRLDPRAVSPNQSGVPTHPLDEVTVVLILHQIF